MPRAGTSWFERLPYDDRWWRVRPWPGRVAVKFDAPGVARAFEQCAKLVWIADTQPADGDRPRHKTPEPSRASSVSDREPVDPNGYRGQCRINLERS